MTMPSVNISCQYSHERTNRAFTLVEAIIAIVLFFMVAGMSIMLLTQTMGSYNKGESTSTSIQEASLLINRIRTDLLQSSFGPETENFDYKLSKNDATDTFSCAAKIDRVKSAISSTVEAPSQEGEVFEFYLNDASNKKLVTYTYKPNEKTIIRKAGTGREKQYAVPRLQNFSITMFCQLSPPDDSSAPAVDITTAQNVFSSEAMTDTKINQFWFKIVIRVKEEETRQRQKNTEVNVESLVFPKQMNRQLQSQWKEWQ